MGDGKMLCFLLLYADLSGPLAFRSQMAWRQTDPEAVALAASETQARSYLDILSSHSKSILNSGASELEALNKVMPQNLSVTKYSRLKEGWLFTCNKFNVFLSCADKVWWEISEKLGQGIATLIRCYEERATLKPFVAAPEVKEMQGNDAVVPQQLEPSQPVVIELNSSGEQSMVSMGNTSEEEELKAAQDFQKAKEVARQAEEKLEKKKEARFMNMLEKRQQQRYELITEEMEARAGDREKEKTVWSELQLQVLYDLFRIRNALLLQENSARELQELQKSSLFHAVYQFREGMVQLEGDERSVVLTQYYDHMRFLINQMEMQKLQAAREKAEQEIARQRQAAEEKNIQRQQELAELQQEIDKVCGGMAYALAAEKENEILRTRLAAELQDKQELQERLIAISREQREHEVQLLQEKEAAIQRIRDQARNILASGQQKDRTIQELTIAVQQQTDEMLSSELRLQHTREKADMMNSLLEMCTSSRTAVQQHVSGLIQRIDTGELRRLTEENLSQLKEVLSAFNIPSANSTPDSIFQNLVAGGPLVPASVYSSPEGQDDTAPSGNTVNQFVLV